MNRETEGDRQADRGAETGIDTRTHSHRRTDCERLQDVQKDR